MESEHLPGGSGGVWRIADAEGTIRVHRPTGPWTAAVHELLAHLGSSGLDGVPAVHGTDVKGREVLDYLPGDTLNPEEDQATDSALSAAAAWLRRFHDAVASFPREPREWRQGVQAPAPGEIICHNDPGLYNWVVRDGEFAGMIDWDRAGPGRPLDDLAFLCWTGVPLMRHISADDAARRITLAAEAYGGVAPEDLLAAVDARMDLIAARWQAGLERADPGTLALRDSGVMARHHARVAQYAARRPHIFAALDVTRSNEGAHHD